MKRFALLLLLSSLLLAACGGTAPVAEEDTPTDEAMTEDATTDDAMTDDAMTDDATTEEPTDEATTEEPTEEPTTEATAEPTEAPTDEATTEEPTAEGAGTDADAAEVRIYTIVPEESEVQYAVDEQFFREGVVDATAIGVTQEISGQVQFDPDNPQNSSIGTITIDISAFQSDSERRDNAIREDWLESATYPIATFEPTSIEGLPDDYTYGEEVTLQITGDLTVRDQTSPTTFETTGVIEDDEMRGTATTTVLMTDFGFDPPDILNVLRAENEVDITLDFVARMQ
jgi:polyisoprenoid-binding protein YceI